MAPFFTKREQNNQTRCIIQRLDTNKYLSSQTSIRLLSIASTRTTFPVTRSTTWHDSVRSPLYYGFFLCYHSSSLLSNENVYTVFKPENEARIVCKTLFPVRTKPAFKDSLLGSRSWRKPLATVGCHLIKSNSKAMSFGLHWSQAIGQQVWQSRGETYFSTRSRLWRQSSLRGMQFSNT